VKETIKLPCPSAPKHEGMEVQLWTFHTLVAHKGKMLASILFSVSLLPLLPGKAMQCPLNMGRSQGNLNTVAIKRKILTGNQSPAM